MRLGEVAERKRHKIAQLQRQSKNSWVPLTPTLSHGGEREKSSLLLRFIDLF